MGEQHGVDIVRNDHACGRLVGELRVERKAKLLEERLGPVKVLHGKVHENLRGHKASLSLKIAAHLTSGGAAISKLCAQSLLLFSELGRESLAEVIGLEHLADLDLRLAVERDAVPFMDVAFQVVGQCDGVADRELTSSRDFIPPPV